MKNSEEHQIEIAEAYKKLDQAIYSYAEYCLQTSRLQEYKDFIKSTAEKMPDLSARLEKTITSSFPFYTVPLRSPHEKIS